MGRVKHRLTGLHEIGLTQGTHAGENTVAGGDTLFAIAARFGTTTAELQRLNPTITNPDQIAVGQVLQVPASRSAGQAGQVYMIPIMHSKGQGPFSQQCLLVSSCQLHMRNYAVCCAAAPMASPPTLTPPPSIPVPAPSGEF